MSSKSEVIFGNPIDKKTIKKGIKSQAKFRKKFGDDSAKVYHFAAEPVPSLAAMGVQKLVLSDQPFTFPANAVIIGNIRMGFGHYRISMAMASCAKALGYTPYWLDLASFDATGSKMIRYQNDLYSTGSKISQKSHLFNHFVWEPMNSEGFRKLSYNSVDQANAELLVPLFHDIPKDTPYIATHVWPSQAAVHAGLTHVVNAIPDNWPMALHLSEGAIHTVQTPFAYLGYKMLNGMAKTPLKGMSEKDLYEVGHYVDDELVKNVDHDSELRKARSKKGEPLRFLLTVGGAGAGEKQFLSMMKHLLPKVEKKEAALFLNFGDHLDMYEYLCKSLPKFKTEAVRYFDEYSKLVAFTETMDASKIEGIYVVYNKDIFEAVYSTNLLMRKCDVLITKPSELAYYPIPKIFMRHIGGHEVYGAVHGQEEGDATFECDTPEKMDQMIDRIIDDKSLFLHLVEQVQKLKNEGMYNGGYEVVKLAVGGRH
jgi:UDP-N-acetylglucosamine:LPS N-acetylglucosamine transferase